MSSFAKSTVSKQSKSFTIKKASKSGNPAKVAEAAKLKAITPQQGEGFIVGNGLSEVAFNYVSLNPRGVKGLLKLAQKSVEKQEPNEAVELLYERFQNWLKTKPKAECQHFEKFNMKAVERLLVQKNLLLQMDPKLDEKTLFMYTKGWMMAEYENIRLKDKQPGFQYLQDDGIDAIIKIFGKEASIIIGLTEESSQSYVKQVVASRLFPVYFTSMLLGYLKHRDCFFE